jgi:diguanylate cyclase (GGDEF)-like protein/PAS domain S-box-containing protein
VKKIESRIIRTPNFNKILERTVSVQIIGGWTILIIVSYFISGIWLNNNLLTHLILWLMGVLGLGLVLSWYYKADNKGKDAEGGQISSLIYRAILETSPDSVAATDLLGNYIFANKQTAVLHGYDTTEEFIGKSAFSLVALGDVTKAMKSMNITLVDGVARNIEFDLLRKDGSTFPAELSAALVRNEFGIPVAFIAITRDITERKHVADQLHDMNEQLRVQLAEIEKLQSILQEQAIQDPLTGLYNRRYMEEALKQEFARARRENQPFSVVMMDMDNLKALNDGHGHKVGDEAIKSLAKLFRELTRVEDTVCRYGGDEYLVILHNANEKMAQARIQEWTQRATEIGLRHEGKVLEVGFSAGVATYPAYTSIDELIQAADEELYKAKSISKKQRKTDAV